MAKKTNQREWYVDYRFFVTAKDRGEAADKVLEFLPDSTDDIWYSIVKVIEKEKEE